MLNWTKTNHRHAFASKYDRFLQLSRRKNWMWEDQRVRRAIIWLRETYGDDKRRMECLDEQGRVYMHRWIPNEHWWIDQHRRRVYIRNEQTITLMALMGVA